VSTLRSLGRIPRAAREKPKEKRDYLRSVLRFDELTVPRKIEDQPTHLKVSYRNREVDVQPCLQIRLLCWVLNALERGLAPDSRGNFELSETHPPKGISCHFYHLSLPHSCDQTRLSDPTILGNERTPKTVRSPSYETVERVDKTW